MAHKNELEKLEQRYRDNPSQWFAALADSYRKAGELELALEVVRSGIIDRPDYASAQIVLGRVLLDMDRDQDAAAAFRRVLELDPENIIALKALSEIAERQKDAPAARAWVRRLLEVDPLNEDAEAALSRLAALDEPVEEDLPTLEIPALPDDETDAFFLPDEGEPAPVDDSEAQESAAVAGTMEQMLDDMQDEVTGGAAIAEPAGSEDDLAEVDAEGVEVIDLDEPAGDTGRGPDTVAEEGAEAPPAGLEAAVGPGEGERDENEHDVFAFLNAFAVDSQVDSAPADVESVDAAPSGTDETSDELRGDDLVVEHESGLADSLIDEPTGAAEAADFVVVHESDTEGLLGLTETGPSDTDALDIGPEPEVEAVRAEPDEPEEEVARAEADDTPGAGADVTEPLAVDDIEPAPIEIAGLGADEDVEVVAVADLGEVEPEAVDSGAFETEPIDGPALEAEMVEVDALEDEAAQAVDGRSIDELEPTRPREGEDDVEALGAVTAPSEGDADVEPVAEAAAPEGPAPGLRAEAGSEPEPVVTETMAEVYAMQGLNQEARAIYEQLLRDRPGDEELLQKLQALDERAARGVESRRRPSPFSTAHTGGPSARAELQRIFSKRLGSGDASGEPGGEEAATSPLARDGTRDGSFDNREDERGRWRGS